MKGEGDFMDRQMKERGCLKIPFTLLGIEGPFSRVRAVHELRLRSGSCSVGAGLPAIRIAAKAAPTGTRNLRAQIA